MTTAYMPKRSEQRFQFHTRLWAASLMMKWRALLRSAWRTLARLGLAPAGSVAAPAPSVFGSPASAVAGLDTIPPAERRFDRIRAWVPHTHGLRARDAGRGHINCHLASATREADGARRAPAPFRRRGRHL